ncbi:MAG: UDP-N-acetylglucosamine--N-acetylmuramyl-(pentapeptide) pyrophosphoryl-undecaprenol N-acetylglucosamine transferase [Patescibacteria group bacterium]|nr:UDP-N-acetylglucosamine--N-acetylmuramyl-(pentapeptide) pyrophosphoryl-undecaprenol N-acetylglucosamine transferase [Patescibacteria group bacterium]
MNKRILLTGGGSGGHIYPLLAVADELKKLASADAEFYYLGPKSLFFEEFKKRNIVTSPIISSKLRRYFDLANIIDTPKFFISLIQALIKIYFIMPDVVFSKGGTGSLSIVMATRFYSIPVIIHESDSVPSLTNRLAAHFAKRIGVSFKKTVNLFPKNKTAFVGNPIREDFYRDWKGQSEAKMLFGFDAKEPLVLILTGSQGSTRINGFIFDHLEELLKTFQILHQAGEVNLKDGKAISESIFKETESDLQNRYKIMGFISSEEMKNALSAADVVVSRAGAGAIYEIAVSGKPVILIPLSESANDHQRENAYEYSKTGAGMVIEESNLGINMLLTEIKNILKSEEQKNKAKLGSREFVKPDAAKLIAQEILILAKNS